MIVNMTRDYGETPLWWLEVMNPQSGASFSNLEPTPAERHLHCVPSSPLKIQLPPSVALLRI